MLIILTYILASESGWKEQALMGVFIKSLSEELKEELASREETKSLEDLISLAIRIDNRLRERNRGRYYMPRRSAPPLELSLSPAVPSNPQTPTEPLVPPAAPEEPMQLGRARLTPSERQCRIIKDCVSTAIKLDTTWPPALQLQKGRANL